MGRALDVDHVVTDRLRQASAASCRRCEAGGDGPDPGEGCGVLFFPPFECEAELASLGVAEGGVAVEDRVDFGLSEVLPQGCEGGGGYFDGVGGAHRVPSRGGWGWGGGPPAGGGAVVSVAVSSCMRPTRGRSAARGAPYRGLWQILLQFAPQCLPGGGLLSVFFSHVRRPSS
jgi:hypothetical protein